MYLDAPVYVWSVQCIYTAFLTGGEGCSHGKTSVLHFDDYENVLMQVPSPAPSVRR